MLGLAETSKCYSRIIKNMHHGATTTVRSAAGLAEESREVLDFIKALRSAHSFLPSSQTS